MAATPIGWDKEAAEDFEEQVQLPGALFRLDGIDRGGFRPLRVQVLIMGADVHVTFILAPRRDASSEDYGKKRTGRDNIVVLALFSLSAIKLYARGYRRIVNSPIDEDVRRLYGRMGFADGKVLDLSDKGSTSALAEFVARCLELFKLNPGPLRF